MWHRRPMWLCHQSPCRHLTARNPCTDCPGLRRPRALGPSQVQGTCNVARCTGSLRPSLVQGGCEAAVLFLACRVGWGAAFGWVAPGQPMLGHRLSPPPASVSPLAAQPLCAAALGGWRLLRRYPALDIVIPGAGSPCSQCFSPLPAKWGCSHARELGHQWGWVQAGLLQCWGKLRAGGVLLCPLQCRRLHTQCVPLCCLPRNTLTSPRSH